MSDAELLRAAIAASGLSARAWYRDMLIPLCGARPPHARTLWRWLAGESPLPAVVRERLERAAREQAALTTGDPG